MKKYENIEQAKKDIENSLNSSLDIARKMFENIPNKTIWRDLAVVTNDAFGQIFDTILEIIYPNSDWKRKRFDEKVKMIQNSNILNDVYARDLVILNKVRVHLAHDMEIDENKIKGFIHDTYTYEHNKEKMKNLSLQEQYHYVSLKIIDILRHHHGQFLTSFLNHLDGWKGSYYNFD